MSGPEANRHQANDQPDREGPAKQGDAAAQKRDPHGVGGAAPAGGAASSGRPTSDRAATEQAASDKPG